MTAEDEEFNRIEMESRIKQEYVRAMKENHEKHVKEHLEFDAHLRIEHLMDELAVARMLIRELGDRLAKLEKPWVGFEKTDMPDGEDPMYDHPFFIAGMVWAANKIKEKNNG